MKICFEQGKKCEILKIQDEGPFTHDKDFLSPLNKLFGDVENFFSCFTTLISQVYHTRIFFLV